jgi:dCMP deaminase
MSQLKKSREEVIVSPVSWDEFFLLHAYLVASKSKDPRTKIGAVLVKDGVVISEGFNGFPRKVKDLRIRYENRDIKYIYTAHAERNAVFNAARLGVSTDGAICYTQVCPCSDCAIALIQAGIQKVITHSFFPPFGKKWQESMKYSRQMFREAKVEVVSYIGGLGTVAYSDGKEFEV